MIFLILRVNKIPMLWQLHLQTRGLTGVGVQTEASSGVARLNSVGDSAVFSFVFISSHHVQNHKPDDEGKLVSNPDP